MTDQESQCHEKGPRQSDSV